MTAYQPVSLPHASSDLSLPLLRNQMRRGYLRATMLKDHPYLNSSFFLLPNYGEYATPVFIFRLCSCSVKFCFPTRHRQKPLPINGEGFLCCRCYYPCNHCRCSNSHPEWYVNLDLIHPGAFLTTLDVFADQSVAQRNAARAKYGASPVTWNAALYSATQAYAKQCKFQHRSTKAESTC